MKIVNLTYYIKDYNLYSGRLLGFIDRAQFFRLFNSAQKFTRKIGSCEGKSLDTISKVKDFKQHRLVLSTSIAGQRYLLVTAEIAEKDIVFSNKELEISMVDVHGNLLHLTEEESAT